MGSAGTDHSFDPSEIEQSIPDRFAKITLAHRDRIAVSAGATRLTYGDLNTASNRIAHQILGRRSDGAEPICLLFPQGADLVAAILGTLKAGKIYLALDPRHSVEDLQSHRVQSGAELIVTDRANRALAQTLVGDKSVLDVSKTGTDGKTDDPALDIAPDRPAYLFYTSGSTGTPKGVVDCHRNVLHNVMRYTNNLEFGPDDRLSMIQSCSFSGTVSSLFGALLNGAAIHPFDLQGQGIEAMAGWLAQDEITIFHSVPMIFEQLAAVAPTLPKLRLIRLEGDRSEPHHVRLFTNRFDPKTVLVNGLGTTETGIVRQFFITHDSPAPETVVPIGYPVTDMDIRLVDEEGVIVSEGEIGEIAVASRYLATGYWRQPGLTGQAFAPDPNDPERRVYRTGDLGRLGPGNCLEYLGRKDFQAKIRGVRIDIAAIEAALAAQPGVDRALVMVREDRPGSQQLVAYLTPAEQPPAVPSVRHALSKSLPQAMVPARYMVLDAFPLDTNRKIDRKALPAPDRTRPDLAEPYMPPETDRQRTIAACFAETLDLDQVGLNDDFFEMGGDSLQATELLLLLNARLEILCTPEFLFSAPTVAGLDQSFDDETRGGALVKLTPEVDGLPLFCIHGVGGFVLEYRLFAQRIGAEHPVYGVQNLRLIDRSEPPPDIAEMAEEAVAEIRHQQPQGPYRICGNCLGGVVALEAARRLCALDQPVDFLGLIDTEFPSGTVEAYMPRRPVREYWAELMARPARQRAAIVVERLKRYAKRLYGLSAYHLRSVTARLTRAPVNAANEADARRRVREQYRPQPYDGPVTLYTSGAPDSRAKWQRILPALQVVEIHGTAIPGRRVHLTGEPYVGDLARMIGDALQFD